MPRPVPFLSAVPPAVATLLAAAVLCVSGPPPNLSAQERDAGFRPAAFALVGGTVVTAPGAEPFVGTVVLRDGSIEAVGPKADVAVPPDAEEIDCDGLHVYAGFIDAATDRPLDQEKLPEPADGRKVNTSRYVLAATRPDNRRGLTPEFPAQEALASDGKATAALRKAGFTAAHLVPRGKLAGGRTAAVTTADVPPREALLADDLFAAVELTALGGRTYPSTLMGGFAHLRQALLDAGRLTKHRALWDAGVKGLPRPPADAALETLARVLSGDLPPLFEVTTADDVRRAVKFAAEYGLTANLDAGPRVVDAVPAAERAGVVVLSLDFPDRPKFEDGKAGTKSEKKPAEADGPDGKDADDAEAADGKAEGEEEEDAEVEPADLRVAEAVRSHRADSAEWRRRVSAPAALHRAGVTFAFSTRGLKSPSEVRAKLRLAVEHGLPRDVALAALTTHAAAVIGQGNRLGTLEAGGLAHVAVMTGPFDHPKTVARHLFIDRERYEPSDDAKPVKADDREAIEAFRPVPPRNSGRPTELKADRLAQQRATGGNLLLTHATVLTGTGETLTDAAVRIVDGKIAALGDRGRIKPRNGETVIDLRGRYVMPGIIDTHSHIMITRGINEATQSITPEVQIRDVIDTDDDSEYRALAGGVTTARLFHGSANVIGGQDAVIKLRYGKTAEEHEFEGAYQGVKFALGENVKDSKTAFPNTRLGVEATLKRAFLEGVDYRRRVQDYERRVKADPSLEEKLLPPRRDLRLEALADLVSGEKFIHSHCYRADEILMLLRTAEELGMRVWSLQHVLEGYKIAPEIAAHGASCSTFSDWWAYKVEAYDATPYNAALLNRAGANVVIKSDDWELIRHLYMEAAKTVRYGNVPPDRALQFVTLNPARELGLQDRIGSIEIGKDADLAVFNGHPLNSFSRCEMTLIDGRVYFDRSEAPSVMSDEAAARSADPPAWEMASPEVRGREIDFAALTTGAQEDGGPDGDADGGASFAVVGAVLHPVDADVIPDGTLVVRDGVIAAVGPRGETDVPGDLPVIDGAGLHVTPGLFDSATELGLTEIGKVSETSDYRETGGIQPDLRAGIALNRDSELFPVARAGGITHALVRPTGGLIAGQASVVRLSGWTAPRMVRNLEFGLQINWPAERGFSPFSGPSSESDDKLKGQIEELTDFFEEAGRYVAAKTSADDADALGPIPDPRHEALAPYLAGEKPVLFNADGERQIVQSLAFAEKFGLTPILTGGADAWKVADVLAEKQVPVIVGPVMRRPLDDADPYDAPYANPGRLWEAGVKFAIHSDEASNSRNTPFEAAQAVAFGLPEAEGLRAVTLSAAEILGVADDVGSLTPGKRADLVIADGSPLQITSRIKAVFVEGTPHPPESRQTRFYENYLRRLRGEGPTRAAATR